MSNYSKNAKSSTAKKAVKESTKKSSESYNEEFSSEFNGGNQEELAAPEMFMVKKERIGKRTVEDYPSKPK